METKSGDTLLLHAGWPNGHWFQRPETGWEISEPIENRDGLDRLERAEEAQSRWVSPFLHSGPPTLSPAPCGPRVWAQRWPPKFCTETERNCTRRRRREKRGETQRGEAGGQDREENAEDPGESGGELQKLTPGGWGRGVERDRMGLALGSQGFGGRGGGGTIPAAGSRCQRGRAESWSGRPALPFLLVADAEAACGEAAPGPHQPQPGRAEAAAAGADPGPGQSFCHPRTPKHPVFASQGFPLGWGHMLHWRP